MRKPVPPEIPDWLSREEAEKYLESYCKAENIREKSFAIYLAQMTRKMLKESATIEVFEVYREKLFEASGCPTDPIECMLIEQIALAHHQIGLLYREVALAGDNNAIDTLHRAAARLLGEFRRSVLALKQYREPARDPHVTVVRQQNVAQSQQVAYVERGAGSEDIHQPTPHTAPQKKTRQDEQGSNSHVAIEQRPPEVPFTQPQTRRRWNVEPATAKRGDGRRA